MYFEFSQKKVSSMSNAYKVIFVSSIGTQLSSQLNIINSFKQYDRDFECEIYLDPLGDFLPADYKKLESNDLKVSSFGLSITKKLIRKFIIKFKNKKFFRVLTKVLTGVFYRGLAKSLLAFSKFNCVVVSEDTNYFALYLVHESNVRKIPSIVFPFSIANHEELIRFRRMKPKFYVGKMHVLKKAFFCLVPQWIRRVDNKTMLASDFWSAFIATILRAAPSNPWVLIGGNATTAIVESQFLKDYFVKSGVPENKIRIVGSCEILKSPLKEEKSPDLRFKVLYSVPPEYIDESCLFQNYIELLEYQLSVLASPEVELILSLHPRIDKSKISCLLSRKNLVVSDKPIEELIPSCDLFVAHFSATIRHALASKKIILNFDVYALAYSEYNDIPMVRTVSTRSTFENEFNRLIRDEMYFDSLLLRYNDFSVDYFQHRENNLLSTLNTILRMEPK